MQQSNSIYLSAGFGDFLAYERFFPQEYKDNELIIYFATRSLDLISKVVEKLGNYKKIVMIDLMHSDDGEDKYKEYKWFNSLLEFRYYNLYKGYKMNYDLTGVVDWSMMSNIKNLFTKYKENPSSLLCNKFCGIEKFNLPPKYIILQGKTSKYGYNISRYFNENDMVNINRYLESNNIFGVIVGEDDPIYSGENIINLCGKTNILESIEIAKNAVGAVVLDSWLSVLAAQLFKDKLLKIKSYSAALKFQTLNTYYGLVNNDIIVNKIEF